MENKKPYVEELSYFNAIACLLVVLIHVLSLGVSQAEPGSWQMAFIYIPWRLSAFVVPAFLFSGAVKMSLSFHDTPSLQQYGKYIAGRFKKIYLPYVLWHSIYYAAFLHIHYVQGSLKDYLQQLLAGSLSSPFYYIILVMQFYLLYPFWQWLVRKVPWHTAILCAVPITFLSTQSNPFFQQFWPGFSYADRLFTSYLLFWTIGLYAGKNYGDFKKSLNLPGAALAATVSLLFTLIAYLQSFLGKTYIDLQYFKPFSDCLSILALLYACSLIQSRCMKLKRPLLSIHKASFSVYLSHCLFLTLCTHYLQLSGVHKLSVMLPARFLACYSLPFLLYYASSALSSRFPKAKHG